MVALAARSHRAADPLARSTSLGPLGDEFVRIAVAPTVSRCVGSMCFYHAELNDTPRASGEGKLIVRPLDESLVAELSLPGMTSTASIP